MANTTWNPSDKTAGVTLSNLNLTATASGTSQGVRAVDGQVTGKFYFEYTCTTYANAQIGLASTGVSLAGGIGSGAAGRFCSVISTGNIIIDGSNSGTSIGAISSGNIVCIAVDLPAKLVWFRIGAAGNWNNSGTANPATGAGGIAITLGGGAFAAWPTLGLASGNTITANFGDSAFTGTVPGGFTSGFTAGANPPTNDVATQLAAEHWFAASPDAQVTQVALEHWATVTGTGLQAIATQIALEHWATVAIRAGGPMITMIG